jgi:hypothetical protein
MAGQKSANWNLTSGFIYGQIPQRSGGTRVSINGTTHISSKLVPGFYTVYGIQSSSMGLGVFIEGGTSTVTASSKSYLVPANQVYDMEVRAEVNDYISAITYTGRVGTLCIYKM